MKYSPESARAEVMVNLAATPHGLPVRWARVASVMVLFALLFRHGFPVADESVPRLLILDLILALAFLADLLVPLVKPQERNRALALRRFEYLALVLFVLAFTTTFLFSASRLEAVLAFLHLQTPAALRFNLLELFLLLAVAIQLLRATERLVGRGVRPEWILAGSFAALVLLSTFLLLLPNSSADPAKPITLQDAFFTATSAACVTGLGVRDTGSDFSGFGQLVIMGTFQLGGLGIITFVAFLSVFSARTLPVHQMVAFRQIVNAPALSDLKRQIVGILVFTFVVEFIGAALIFNFHVEEPDPLARVQWSVFHSVSAFCNAGFALQGNSLEPYQSNPGLIFTIMALIILGGLGFLVISELTSFRFTRTRLFRHFGFFRRLHFGQAPAKLSVQTRLALTVTALLLLISFVLFWALELNHLLRHRTFTESFLIASFQAVTPRTAGFNSIPIGDLRDATLVLVMMLMVIGANPVSTGGGIKTVTFVILLLALRSMVTRRERVEAFGRTVPIRTLLAALSVFFLYVITASLGIFLLSLFDPAMRLQDQAFEVISALSTVGLSTGITAGLSTPSQLVLCVLMFIGRVGPISLVLSVFQSKRRLNYAYPEEEVVVG